MSDEELSFILGRRAKRDAQRLQSDYGASAREAIAQNADTTFSLRLGAKDRMLLQALAGRDGKGHTQLAREILQEGIARRWAELTSENVDEGRSRTLERDMHLIVMLASSLEARLVEKRQTRSQSQGGNTD